MSATPEQVAAAQEAMGKHWIDWSDADGQRGYVCNCGSYFGRDEDGFRNEHKARAVADAVAAAGPNPVTSADIPAYNCAGCKFCRYEP